MAAIYRYGLIIINFLCMLALLSAPTRASVAYYADVKTREALNLQRLWAKTLIPDAACLQSNDFDCLSRFLWRVTAQKRERFAGGVIPASAQRRLATRYGMLHMMVRHGQYETAAALYEDPAIRQSIVGERRSDDTSTPSLSPDFIALQRDHRFNSLVHLGAFDAARTIAETYDDGDARDTALFTIADAMHRAGNHAAARELYLEINARNPDLKCLASFGERLLSDGIIGERCLNTERLGEIHREQRLAHAVELSRRGEHDKAISLLEALTGPYEKQEAKQASEIYRRAGAVERAIEIYFKGDNVGSAIIGRDGGGLIRLTGREYAEQTVKVAHMADLLVANGLRKGTVQAKALYGRYWDKMKDDAVAKALGRLLEAPVNAPEHQVDFDQMLADWKPKGPHADGRKQDFANRKLVKSIEHQMAGTITKQMFDNIVKHLQSAKKHDANKIYYRLAGKAYESGDKKRALESLAAIEKSGYTGLPHTESPLMMAARAGDKAFILEALMVFPEARNDYQFTRWVERSGDADILAGLIPHFAQGRSGRETRLLSVQIMFYAHIQQYDRAVDLIERFADTILRDLGEDGRLRYGYAAIALISRRVADGHSREAMNLLQALGYQGTFIRAFFDGMSDALYGEDFQSRYRRRDLCGRILML